MAQFDASILFKSEVDQSSLNRAITRITQVTQLANKIKPISLFDKTGSEKEIAAVEKELAKIVKAAGTIAKGKTGPGKLSGSLAGAAQQARVLQEALSNVNLKTRGAQEEVETLAAAYGQAAVQAEVLNRTTQDYLNNAAAAAARSKKILTPDIQNALSPTTTGTVSQQQSNEQTNAALNQRAKLIEDSINDTAEAEVRARKEVKALEESLIRDLFELETRYQDDLVQQKISKIDDVANRQLAANKKANDAELKDFDARLNQRLNRRLEVERRVAKERERLERKAANDDKKRLRDVEAARRKRNKRLGDALTSAGFSSLFGGGVGRVLGSAAGGFLGGIGGGLIGDQIGGFFDDIVVKANALGTALNQLSGAFDEVKQKSLFSTKQEEKRGIALNKLGLSVRADQLAIENLVNTFGSSKIDNIKILLRKPTN